MNKQNFTRTFSSISLTTFRPYFFLAAALLMMAIALAAQYSCSKKSPEVAQMDVKELSAHYRPLVQAEFAGKAAQYKADTRYLILVDYSIPSNNNRMFVWDTELDGIVEQFWCAHGFGGQSTAERPEFSNVLGSNCSSLGWFLVDRSVGKSPRWGYNYHAVDGLDACNSNARQRQLLIHPWGSVGADAAAKINHPMALDGRSAGCFTTSEDGFLTIDRYVKESSKRLLLLAIDGVK